MHEAKPLLPESIDYVDDLMDAIRGADAVILMTEWNQYRGLDLAAVSEAMRGDVFVDLRNVYERPLMEKVGLKYHCVGR